MSNTAKNRQRLQIFINYQSIEEIDVDHKPANIAIFWDIENVKNHKKNDSADSHFIDALISYGQSLGKIILRRAYANFDNNKNDLNLNQQNFEVILYIPKPIANVKNSTDIYMTVDIMKHLQEYRNIEIYILVNGDSDFLPLVQNLQLNGKKVIIVCNAENGSQILILMAKAVKALITILKEAPNKTFNIAKWVKNLKQKA